MSNLHIESEAHLLLKVAEIDFNHTFDEGLLINVVVGSFLKLTEESVIDYPWQESVFKECHFINKIELVVCILWAVPSQRNVLENSREIRFCNVVEELCVFSRGIVFDENHIFAAVFFTELRGAHLRGVTSG